MRADSSSDKCHAQLLRLRPARHPPPASGVQRRGARIVLGGAFEILGLVSLFSTTALLLVIVVLMAQNVWSIAAALVLALNSAKPVVA